VYQVLGSNLLHQANPSYTSFVARRSTEWGSREPKLNVFVSCNHQRDKDEMILICTFCATGTVSTRCHTHLQINPVQLRMEPAGGAGTFHVSKTKTFKPVNLTTRSCMCHASVQPTSEFMQLTTCQDSRPCATRSRHNGRGTGEMLLAAWLGECPSQHCYHRQKVHMPRLSGSACASIPSGVLNDWADDKGSLLCCPRQGTKKGR
jgi:hypothetical protein